jgi:ATP-dependent DNA helicase RecG
LLPNVAPFDLPELSRSLTALAGVGPATAKAWRERGCQTWGDALFFLPLRYEDRRSVTPVRELVPGQKAVIRGKVLANGPWGRARKAWRLVLADEGGRVTCLWFHFKRAQLEAYAKGQELIVVGAPEKDKAGGLTIAHPLIFNPAEAEGHPGLGRIVPIYPDIEGVALTGSAGLFAPLLVSALAAAILGRALFYVLVMPTTLPGAFFWRNRGFVEHAREVGLARMPQLGVVPEAH